MSHRLKFQHYPNDAVIKVGIDMLQIGWDMWAIQETSIHFGGKKNSFESQAFLLKQASTSDSASSVQFLGGSR